MASEDKPAVAASVPAARPSDRALRVWGFPLAIFAAATAVHVVAVWVMSKRAGTADLDAAHEWGSGIYLSIAESGYPTHLAAAPHGSKLGFYPGYPLVVRALPLGDYNASLLAA